MDFPVRTGAPASQRTSSAVDSLRRVAGPPGTTIVSTFGGRSSQLAATSAKPLSLATAPGAMPAYPATLAELPAVRKHLAQGASDFSFPGAAELVQRLVTVSGRASR